MAVSSHDVARSSLDDLAERLRRAYEKRNSRGSSLAAHVPLASSWLSTPL